MRLPTANDFLQETSDKLRPVVMRAYPLYVWLIVAPLMLLTTLVCGLGAFISVNFVGPKRAGWFGVIWARIGLWLAGIKVTLEGADNIPPNQSLVIVANHLSHVDIWLLYGYLPVDFRWVMKQELRHVPIIGIACAKIGHVFIDRGQHAAALASLEHAKQNISGGTSIIFFPEGTRSRDGRLHPFKKGAFHMAHDLNLPVLPVSLIDTDKVLPAATFNMARHPVRLVIHPPLAQPANRDADAIAQLQEQSQQLIASVLER